MSEIIIALDFPSQREALELVDQIGDGADFYKVGLELFTREGPGVVRALRGRGKRVFLDLKMMDIPNTVGRAVKAAADLDVELLTLHAAGGTEMMKAAQEAAGDRLVLLAVTVLTSTSQPELEEIWGRQLGSVRDEVLRLADLARGAGIGGVVASAQEAEDLRARLGSEMLIVTPGIRLPSGSSDDQARVTTPQVALQAGATHLVVGRPITRAEDPVAALAEFRDHMALGKR